MTRYLARERVRDQTAFEDAQRDHRDAARRREATGILPQAWRELAADAHDQLLEALTDKTEALCGYKPAQDEVIRFLRSLEPGQVIGPAARPTSARAGRRAEPINLGQRPGDGTPANVEPITPGGSLPDKTVSYVLRGQECTAANANLALVEILRHVVAADLDRIPELARAVSGTRINHIARSPAEINPAKPHLARAVEIAPGWSVGLNISNKTKMGIIRTACELYGLQMPEEIDVSMPNAE